MCVRECTNRHNSEDICGKPSLKCPTQQQAWQELSTEAGAAKSCTALIVHWRIARAVFVAVSALETDTDNVQEQN